MELYLDSADISEIKSAFELAPYITGLTTTPTFMHRHGITDVDGTILELAKIVPVLQIEALGNTAEKIFDEAQRQLDLGLDKTKTVFKIPVSLEGLKACEKLISKGFLVNVHLIYSLQQAYMALHAGASYVCPLVGRLQDQGHDALSLVAQCVDTVESYGYNSKIMFSSVRNAEHIKNALNIGVHTCTIPWKIMKQLSENHLTTIGTNEFVEHTKLMTLKVADVISAKNPVVNISKTVADSLEVMTSGGFGVAVIKDDAQKVVGIFTDGDLRRLLQKKGKEGLNTPLSEYAKTDPKSIESDASLYNAMEIITKNEIDNLLVTENGKQVGVIDIQEITNSKI